MKSLYIFATIILIVFTTFLNGCKKDDESLPPPTQEPGGLNIETISATVYQDGGVTLVGKVNKVSSDVSSYGFLISRDSLFVKNRLLYSMKGPLVPGDFKTDVNSGIVKDSLYYVTTYAIIKNELKTFNVKKFISNGAKRIKIDSISPLKALIGDTLSLRGKYFDGHILTIKFGDIAGSIVSSNDSIIKVTVPPNLRVYNPIITVTGDAKVDTVSSVFSLYTPRIDEFTTLGTFRDTVVIKGDYFSRFLNGNIVSFGNVQASIISYSKQQLKVIVPDDIEFSKTLISLKAQVQTVVTTTPFVIKKPELLSVPQAGNINDPIVIQGKNFHPVLSKNTLTFENNVATINSGTTSQFSLNIPNGPYPNRTATVVLKLLDYEITYPVKVSIKDKWIMASNKIPFSEYTNSGAFTIGNISYVIARSKDFLDYKKYVWKFNPTDFSWQKLEIPFNFDVATAVAVGSKAYLYTSKEIDNFWEYDPATNQWTKKANYSAGIRQGGALFAIGQDVYLGMGRAAQPFGQFVSDNTFYKYNINTNQWEKETDYPTGFSDGERVLPSTFVIGQKVYLGCGSTNTGMLQFHSYTPATKTWTRLADFPDARIFTTSFAYLGNGYIATGTPVGGSPTRDVFKYYVSSNTWVRMPDFIGVPELQGGIEKGYAFVNNGRVYFGGGSSSSDRYELYMAQGDSL